MTEQPRKISDEDIPEPLRSALLDAKRDMEEHGTVALPDFPDQPGRYKIRFSRQAALEYLDLKNGEPDLEEP